MPKTSPTVVIFGSFAPSLLNFRGPLIEALVAAGARVVAIAPDIDTATADGLARLGAEHRSLALSNTSLNPLAATKSLATLTGLFADIRPDVMMAYTIKPVILGSLAARRAGVKRIVALITGLGYAFTGGREPKRVISYWAGLVLYKIALSCCACVIFQNQDDREYFRRKGLLPSKARIAVVDGSGVDIERFAVRPLPDQPAFLMIARLLKDKGVREFADAGLAIKQKYPQVPVRLVGPFDPSPDSISQDDLDRFIAGGVEYLGRKEDVREALSEASVYVLPSYREGTPRSVLEAMAMGRAIITTDAPGCRETVIDRDNGLLVPPRQTAPLAKAMEEFITEPGLASRMGRRSREIAEHRYDVHRVNCAMLGYLGLDESGHDS